jgi:hypothetical protein
VSPRKRNSLKGNVDLDRGLYCYRHLVENAISRLKHYRGRGVSIRQVDAQLREHRGHGLRLPLVSYMKCQQALVASKQGMETWGDFVQRGGKLPRRSDASLASNVQSRISWICSLMLIRQQGMADQLNQRRSGSPGLLRFETKEIRVRVAPRQTTKPRMGQMDHPPF